MKLCTMQPTKAKIYLKRKYRAVLHQEEICEETTLK